MFENVYGRATEQQICRSPRRLRFGAEGDDGIDSRGAMGGEVGSEECQGGEHGGPRPRNEKDAGNTPMTSAGLPSITSRWPTTLSAPGV